MAAVGKTEDTLTDRLGNPEGVEVIGRLNEGTMVEERFKEIVKIPEDMAGVLQWDLISVDNECKVAGTYRGADGRIEGGRVPFTLENAVGIVVKLLDVGTLPEGLIVGSALDVKLLEAVEFRRNALITTGS